MKKLIYCVASAAIMLGVASCSNGNKTTPADSVQDTTATVAVDTPEVVEEPAPAPAEEVNPQEVLSLTVVKKNLQHVPESSFKSGSWTVKVTNNGSAPVNGTDYVVAYDEIIEDWVGTPEDGGLDDVTKKRTAPGKDVNPGESVEIVLKATDGCQDFKNPKIKNTK